MKLIFLRGIFWTLFGVPILTFLTITLYNSTNGRVNLMNENIMWICFLTLPVSAIYFLVKKIDCIKYMG